VQIKTPSSSNLLKTTALVPPYGENKGARAPKKEEMTQGITLKELYHLAIFKKCDVNNSHISVKSHVRSLIGTAKSMGLNIFGACPA
jgi:ribosomal protein L11